MNDVLVPSRREASLLTRLVGHRFGLAALIATVTFLGVITPSQAVPYASRLVNDAGTVSFRLNESADSVKVVSNSGATTNDLGALAAGLHSFPLGISGTFQVVVFKVSPPGFVTPIAPNRGGTLQISTDNPTLRFNSPRGLAVNKNPASPYFGRVYVSNSSATNSPRPIGDGIYVLNPDLTDAVGQGDTALTAGLDFSGSVSSSPYRLTVGADDNLYVADWADVSASLYVTDPNVAPGTGLNVLGGAIGGPFPVTATRIHGSIAAAIVEGSLANGNLTAYVLDEDLQDSPTATVANQRQSLWRHDIGASLPGPFVMPTRVALHATTFLRGVGNQTVDLARGTNGNFFVSNFRSTGAEANIWVVDSTGAVVWNSLIESRALTGVSNTNDLLRATGAIDLAPAGDFLAAINIETNGITLVPLINGTPDLTNRLALNGFNTVTGQGRELAFDLAGNLYAVSSGAGVLRAFSPGGTTTAVTGSDGSFEMIRPPGVSVVATDALASEDGSDTATFTITRAGDSAVDQTVLYTLAGTASNGTDYTTNVLSAIIPAGSASVDITITGSDDAIAEASETVILTLVGTAEYDIKAPVFATAFIADNETPVLTVSGTDTNSYEAFTADKIVFQFQRIGSTNEELFVLYTTEGSASRDVDYSALNGGFLPDTLYFAPGQLTLTLTLEPFEDTEVEGDEIVTLRLLPDPSFYLLGSPSSASARLRDNEWSPGTLLFADDFEVDSAANWTTRFGASNSVFDATTSFAFNYGAFGIPAAPHSSSGTTLGLFVTVNKDTIPSTAGINLYPAGQSFSGNHVLRFDMFMSIGPSNATEHALAGINHSGMLTNRITQSSTNRLNTSGSDGIWFGIEAAAGNLRDYAAYSATNTASEPALIVTRAASTVSSLVTRPPYTGAGSPGCASNSTTKAWSSVEIAQVGNVVTLKVNQALILQITNTYGFNAGNIMLGYNDQFESRGSDLSFVVFDNVQVVSTEIKIQSIRLLEGNLVQIDFIAPSGLASDFRLQSTPSFSPIDWADDDTAVITARTGSSPGFRAVVAYSGLTKFYRIRQ